jgi:hypothetical protein
MNILALGAHPGGIDFLPEVYVNIGGVRDRKLGALSKLLP